MTIGMGIAFGALSPRIATWLAPEPAPGSQFSRMEFRWAFTMAAVLTMSSAIGYFRLLRDAGNKINDRR